MNDDTNKIINKAYDAVLNYKKWVSENQIHPDEKIDIKINERSGKASASYTNPLGSFKVSVLKNDSPSLTIKSAFGPTKFNAKISELSNKVEGDAPVFCEHWNNFHDIFVEDDDQVKKS